MADHENCFLWCVLAEEIDIYQLAFTSSQKFLVKMMAGGRSVPMRISIRLLNFKWDFPKGDFSKLSYI